MILENRPAAAAALQPHCQPTAALSVPAPSPILPTLPPCPTPGRCDGAAV